MGQQKEKDKKLEAPSRRCNIYITGETVLQDSKEEINKNHNK